MKKILSFILTISLFLSFTLLTAISANANQSDEVLETYEEDTTNEKYPFTSNLYVSQYVYVLGAEISPIISVTYSHRITDIDFEGDGFALQNDFLIEDNKIYFSVLHIEEFEDPYFKVSITLDDGNIFYEELFGVTNEELLFVNPHTYFFAEQTKDAYYDNNTDIISDRLFLENLIIQNELSLGNDNISELMNNTTPHNTTISGFLEWADIGEGINPLRFVAFVVYRTDVSPAEYIYFGFTNNNGEFSFSFLNNDADGLADLSITVYAQGQDVSVYSPTGALYSYTFTAEENDSLRNIPAVNRTVSLHEFDASTNDASTEYRLFCQALQIAESAIAASIYYEAMNEQDVNDVDIVYPHQENNATCFYIESEQTIYIMAPTISTDAATLPSYAACDVITHEYGHHVACCEGIDNSPGGTHGAHEDMSEHYKQHFGTNPSSINCNNQCALKVNNPNGYNFSEDECKYNGAVVAWAEGFATFFCEIAQQYFKNNYINYSNNPHQIPTFADLKSTDTKYTDDNIETKTGSLHQNSERMVTLILYDLYDGESLNSDLFDSICIEERSLWNMIMASGAVNLYEFLDFFKIAYTNDSDLLNLGKILSGNNLIYSNFELTEVTTFTPAVKIKWVERNSSGYYNARLFQINFYDYYHLNLIYSTDATPLELDQALQGFIDISDELWKTLINEYRKFYITLTVYEADGDICNYGNDDCFITSVESEYKLYDTSSISTNISRDSVLTDQAIGIVP